MTSLTDETGIKVNYKTFESNEQMYSVLRQGGVSYDVIIPSDYMISRLIEEDMLEPINFDNVPNYSLVDETLKGMTYDPENKYINMDILNDIENSDKVIIAGEAMDYCVYESLRQILDYFKDRDDIAAKIYVLEDCMSSIQDRAAANKMYQELQSRHKIHIVRSTDKFL